VTNQEKEPFEITNELTKKRLLARKKQRRKQVILHGILCSAVIIILISIVVLALSAITGTGVFAEGEKGFTKYIQNPPTYTQQFLTVNEYARPGIALEQVNGIVDNYEFPKGIEVESNGEAENIKESFKLVDKSILSFMLINICFLLYSQIQGVFVSTQVPKVLAALYFAANTIAGIIMLLISAQVQKIMPEFIDISPNKALTLLKNEVKKMNIITISTLVFFILFGKTILEILYGQVEYKNAYFILLILSIANIFYGMGKVYITYIMAKNKTNIIWQMQIKAIIISIFTLLLTYKYGIYSAALAYLLSASYIGIAYMQKTKQLLKNKT